MKRNSTYGARKNFGSRETSVISPDSMKSTKVDRAWLVAVHEAGHAIMSFHYGVPVKKIEVKKGGRGDGLVLIGLSDLEFEPWAHITLGGVAASGLCGFDTYEDGAYEDTLAVVNQLDNAEWIPSGLDDVESKEDGIRRTLRELLYQTVKILSNREYEDAIIRLAAELVSRGRLRMGQFETIVGFCTNRRQLAQHGEGATDPDGQAEEGGRVSHGSI